MTPLLTVEALRIEIPRAGATPLTPVGTVSFEVARGEVLALVGESGCGKSLTGLALLGLLPPAARLGADTSIRLDGEELVGLEERALRTFRGARIAMIFQDPMGSLNPVMRVGDQIIEALTAHQTIARAEARTRAIALLVEVGIPDPTTRVDAWPHQLSGGMRQRVMIAIALAGEPDLLIADEPTTALDVTIQAQILELVETVCRARGMAVLLITHDLGIVAGRADRAMVMYAGRIVEIAPTADLFRRPQHPYTRALLASRPRLDVDVAALPSITGVVPSAGDWPTGCRFHPRCPSIAAGCGERDPTLAPLAPGHSVACWVAHEGGGP